MKKVVKGYEWLTVDENGNTFSSRTGKPYKPYKDKDGYLKVGTHVSGKGVRCFVHRAVALMFVPNPENKPQVNHKNSKRDDPKACNLEWVTAEENSRHGLNEGNITGDYSRGASNGQAVVTEDTVRGICVMLEEGFSNTEVAKKFNVLPKLISDIRVKSTWVEVSENYNIPVKRKLNILESDVEKVCKRFSEGFSVNSTSKLLGISRHTTTKIYKRLIFTEISSKYKW